MKNSQKFQIVIVVLAVIFLGTGFLTGKLDSDEPNRLLSIKERIKKNTEERLQNLENKVKYLESNRKVSFPEKRSLGLTKNEINAIVELWCPDDKYGHGSQYISIGSGSIISSDGLIVTNRHVILSEDKKVISSSPTCYVAITDNISEEPKIKYTADLVAYSPANSDDFDFDVAMLYINDICHECDNTDSLPSSFSYLETGYSSDLGLGDYIAVAGYPEIGAGTFNLTEGVVSGLVGEFVIKTDAKIDSGSSGGSALNSNNELIGIPSWTIAGQAESLGYIIGIDQIINWYNTKVASTDNREVAY